MMQITNNLLTYTRHGVATTIQRVTEQTRYDGLRAFGISEGRAKAVASGLAILKGAK